MPLRKVRIYEQGVDKGWLVDKGSLWWFDPEFEHAFTYFDLNTFYEDIYFARDHVPEEIGRLYVDYVLSYGSRLLGHPVQSVLELGCGGGWFTIEFLRRDVDIVAVEGTIPGYQRTLKRGVPPERVIRHDLREPLYLNRRFDVVVCTEVAEHVECPFAGQLVRNIVTHGKVVWFSYEPPNTNPSHYHHVNEQPEQFWQNLFLYFNYRLLRLPSQVTDDVHDRGRCLFYTEEIALPPDLAKDEALLPLPPPQAAGQSLTSTSIPSAKIKHLFKQLLPPLLVDAIHRRRRS